MITIFKTFVSYTLRDKKLNIEKLESLKRQLPLMNDSYIDIIDNDSTDKQERVEKELKSCDCLLKIDSTCPIYSPWVSHEMQVAISRGIPIFHLATKHITNCKTMEKHKVFISYHHDNDQWAKDRLIELNNRYHFFYDCSVSTGDIPDAWEDQTIRTEIRDNYLRESTVTILLVGTETKNRKHIDWELYSSMYDGIKNKKSALVVIMLPSTNCRYCNASHSGEKESVFPQIDDWTKVDTRSEYERLYPFMPARIIDNLLKDGVRISVANWNDLTVEKLNILIDNASNDREYNDYDLKRPMRRINS